MPYNLLFYKPLDTIVDFNQVIQYFQSLNWSKIKPYDTDFYQFIYQNEQTGVNFIVIYNTLIDSEENIPVFDNYSFSYLSFGINYLRPSFFGREALPIIADFCESFGLIIYDPQNPKSSSELKNYTKDELIESYDHNNHLAITDFDTQSPVDRIAKEKCTEAYNYMKRIDNLVEEYSDINISELSFMKNKHDKLIYTVISWYNGSKLILPKVDYVIIVKEKKSFLFKKQTTGIIKYESIVSTFSTLIEKIADDLLLVNEDIDLFNQLELESIADFDLITVEEFVDY